MKTTQLSNLFTYLSVLYLLLFIPSLCFSQDKTKFYLNIGGQGIETSINTKIYGDFNAEVFAGYGPGFTMVTMTGKYGVNFKQPTPFVKGAVKWNFTNKEKKRNYIGVQSKYSFGQDDDYSYDKVSIHEIHLGIERNLGKRFIFNTHLGVGHLTDHDIDKSTTLLTLGLTFKFNYLKF